MVTKALDYALRALTYISSGPAEKFFGVRELAGAIDAPATYLGKVLQNLVRIGYLKSTTGPGGGFALSRPPEEISLLDLIHAIDGEGIEAKCVLGLDQCTDEKPCPVHALWVEQRELLITELKAKTLSDSAELLQQLQKDTDR